MSSITTVAKATTTTYAQVPHSLESLQSLFSHTTTPCAALILGYLGLYTAESLADLCHLIALHAEWADADPYAVDGFVFHEAGQFEFPLLAGFLRCA